MLVLVSFIIIVLSLGFFGKYEKITGNEHPYKTFLRNRKNNRNP